MTQEPQPPYGAPPGYPPPYGQPQQSYGQPHPQHGTPPQGPYGAQAPGPWSQTPGPPWPPAQPWPHPGTTPAWPPYDPKAPRRLVGAERFWVPAAHWLALISSWLGPLVVLLTVGESHPRVREHAKESLNFEVTIALVMLVVALAGLQTAGSVLWVVPVWVLWIVARLWATVHAAAGRTVRYPVSLRIVR
ncbi:MAG: DUF4870 domain-containing protein [Propioniciclava sp.]|uniref:DUF4870 domain-containing protein n=1 Tax=Propioniciclava sp. TaxID=2038686 RepID=UPI0039E23752